jgi:hypothetical protein
VSRLGRELLRFALALALPRRLGPVRVYLAAPLIVRADRAVRDRLGAP